VNVALYTCSDRSARTAGPAEFPQIRLAGRIITTERTRLRALPRRCHQEKIRGFDLSLPLGLTYQKLNDLARARTEFREKRLADPKSPLANEARRALSQTRVLSEFLSGAGQSPT